MELFLPCPTSVRLGCGADNLQGHSYSCQVWAWSRRLLRHPHAQVDEEVAEEVVLPKEQRFRTAPSVYP
jgi:hypothetical protein